MRRSRRSRNGRLGDRDGTRLARKPRKEIGMSEKLASPTITSALDDAIPSHWTCDNCTAALIYERFIRCIDEALAGQLTPRRISEFLDLRTGVNTLTLYMLDAAAREIARKLDLDMHMAHAIVAQRDDGAWYSVPRVSTSRATARSFSRRSSSTSPSSRPETAPRSRCGSERTKTRGIVPRSPRRSSCSTRTRRMSSTYSDLP